MPNPKGNFENLSPYTTDRVEPLTAKLTVRIPQSMMDAIKTKKDMPEFVRQAIQKALDEDSPEEPTEEW